jgi:hypothetical protein
MTDAPTLPPLPVRLRQSAEEVAEFPHPSFCDHLHDASAVMREAAAEIERLTAALAAAEVDAQRYQWLRSSSNVDGPHVYGPDDDCILEFEACDAAIDAAQKEKP